MPTLKLTNLAAYKQYWSDIATKHKSIGRSYYGDKDVVSNELRSNAATAFLWIAPYQGAKYSNQGSDNIIKKKTGKVAFMKKVSDNKFATIDTAYQECEAVIDDIVTQLELDKKGKDVNGVWNMIVLNDNSMGNEPVEEIFGSSHYIGCELSFEFGDNTALQYDATKWNP